MPCPGIHPPPSRGPTCAVVGSAVQHTPYGELIDTYNRVWRTNDAPTRHFEKYVGSFTTDRVINRVSVSVWAGKQQIKTNELLEEYHPHAFDPGACYNFSCVLIDSDPNTISMLKLARNRFPFLSIKVNHKARTQMRVCGSNGIRSTGFLTVMLAMQQCKAPIGLFGFEPDCCDRDRYKYYHTNASSWVCCAKTREDMSSELKLYMRMASMGYIWRAGARIPSRRAAKQSTSLDVPRFKRVGQPAKAAQPAWALYRREERAPVLLLPKPPAPPAGLGRPGGRERGDAAR